MHQEKAIRKTLRNSINYSYHTVSFKKKDISELK